jgi:hypothetical protein
MVERLKELRILEPLGVADYSQKYVYGDYYKIFDEAFRQVRKKSP